MKKYLIYIVVMLLFSTDILAQKDTVFLLGNARLYSNKSVSLRWNTLDAMQYYNISKSTFVVERKADYEDSFKPIATQTPKSQEGWKIDVDDKNTAKLIAAGSLFNLDQQMQSFSTNLATQLEQLETCNLLWANISLMADLHKEIPPLTQLGYLDNTPPSASQLTYRVYFISTDFLSDTIEFTIYDDEYTPPAMGSFFATENEGYISFTIPAKKTFSGYYIQKSQTGKNKFTNLNNSPLVVPGNQGDEPTVYWTDSVENYIAFDYRIYAIDMFGDTSEYSTLLTAQGRDRTPPPMLSGLKVIENGTKSLTISWDAFKPKYGEKGIAIGLRHLPEDAFVPLHEKLLPNTQTSFEIPIVNGETNYHITVQLFDTAGNSSSAQAFYQLEDNTPPEKPKNVKAVVNREGIVTLTWDWNNEPDLGGYFIYIGYSRNGEFSGIQNIALDDTFYFDTISLSMLNREVYYFVTAGDNRSNRSLSSDTVSVLRPDTLWPVSPIITDYTVSDTAVYINWTRSTSADVAFQYLHKKHSITGKVQTILINSTDSMFKDTDISDSITYLYYLKAIDSSKNESPFSNSVSLKPYKNFYKPAVSIVVVQYDSVVNTATIRWQYDHKNVERIELYKGKTISTVAYYPVQIAKNATSFIDTKIIKGEPYYYAIQLHFSDGTKTKLSNAVGIAF